MVVLANTAVSPQQSVRKIAFDTVLPKSHVHHIKQHNKFHLYKIYFVQELHGDDTDHQVKFCG
jgi:hypothetical protein